MTALLHELFEEQVRRTPDAIATRFGDRTLTYAALNARSNRLARHLRSVGVSPAAVVAIGVPRSDVMVAAVLAVLKAGGTYTYLDSGDPDGRRRRILDASGAGVLITVENDSGPADRVVAVNAEDEFAEQQDGNLCISVAENQAAYLLFTSGSTGQPKGVLVSHGSAASYLGWAVKEYEIAGGSGAPVHTSLGFDLTVTSLFGPLVCGRTAVILPEADVLAQLARELAAGQDFSILKLTPSHLMVLGDYVDAERLTGSVRTLIVGGEALRSDVLSVWRTHAPRTRIVNEYGPTEATVGCCRYWLTDDNVADPVPIGSAAPTTELHVLDDAGKPVSDGDVGELYITGSQLAIGYLGNDELTSERFVELEMPPKGHRRAYRTGDLVRSGEDGQLIYVGRNDRQVKVRGYRVELDEIEIALCNHPHVADARVILDDGIISAYVRCRADMGGLGTAQIADHVRRALPPYMLPSRYLMIDEIPLTPNGKVDYQRLADLEVAKPKDRMSQEEMCNVMLRIWSAVLNEEVDDLDTSFFSLGGDSILAVQMVAQARELGVPISLRQVFAQTTIRKLAEAVAADAETSKPDPELEDIVRSVTREAGLA